MQNRLKTILGVLITALAVSCVSFTSFVSAIAFATDLQVSAFAEDTIAGYSTTLHSSPVGVGKTVYFNVVKPDSSNVEISSTSSYSGIAELTLQAFHTRLAGIYKVSSKLDGGTYGTPVSFNVLPGEVSEVYSGILPTEQVVRIGQGYGEIELDLKDAFGNPISGHMVELISSRSGDNITSDSKMSDSNGMVLFSVNSSETGVSTYSAYDMTSNKTLDQRAKVVYFDSVSALISHAAGNSSGPAKYFEFKDVPSTANIGQSLSLTLNVLDSSNQPVTDYTGTVKFSLASGSSASASLPSNYTFVPQDIGTHTFALATSFNNSGAFVVKAEDLSNPEIFGTFSINVASVSGGATSITMTNPVTGSYSNNIQVVSGKTNPGLKVFIYDNGAQVGNATSDLAGNYVFTTGFLTDGAHEIFTALTNEVGTITASSAKVSITVDTTPPVMEKAEIIPSLNVTASSSVELRVYAETGLSAVTATVGANTYEMSETSGVYKANFKAPSANGTYQLKFTLVDALGNTTNVNDKGSMVVSGGGATGTAGAGTSATLGSGTLTGGLSGTSGSGLSFEDIPGQSNVSSTFDVSGLKAFAEDHKVTVTWTPPQGGQVQFYRVYYGISANQLIYAIDTWDSKTAWYVPNLKNDIEYFFAVVAVDAQGNKSPHMSNIVSAIPGTVFNPVPPIVANGTAGSENIPEMTGNVNESGPEALWVIFVSLIGGFCYSVFSNKKLC